MAGTMLGKAVNFDSSRELRPTPNTSIFVPKFEVAVYNCKMLYSSPRPHMQRNRLLKKKKSIEFIFPKTGQPYACSFTHLHIRGCLI